MDPQRPLSPQEQPQDLDRALRPQTLDDFVGQAEARANLRVFIQSAKTRGEAMDHTLFHGPPGLGKTTLAQIMARDGGYALCGACSSSNARCSTRTASSRYFSSMTTAILISEVEIIWMLMPSSASVLNIFEARPTCERMPMPTTAKMEKV